ncbi:MAG: PEP-CTERM sorting domain-containing protein [Burkholderiaceae bacterium]
MKLHLKSIIAAAALAVVAGQASAAIPLNNVGTGSGLIFYAFDDGTTGQTKESFVMDLGQTFSSFLPTAAAAGGTFNTAISTSAAWANFVAAEGNDLSNVTWGVVAGLSANASNSGNGLETTLRVGDSTAGQSAANVKGAVGTPLRNAILGINTATSNAAAGYFTNSGGSDNIANNFGSTHNGAGKLVFRTDNSIGTVSTFEYLNANSNAADTTYANANGNSTFSFDGNNLTYTIAAAVPEPSSYAMLLAGLMLVGGIAARRRNSAK